MVKEGALTISGTSEELAAGKKARDTAASPRRVLLTQAATAAAAGDYFGEAALVGDGAVRAATLVAKGQAEVFVLSRTHFQAALEAAQVCRSTLVEVLSPHTTCSCCTVCC